MQHLFRIQLQKSLCNTTQHCLDIAKQCQQHVTTANTLSQHLQHCRQTFATSRHKLHNMSTCLHTVCTCLHKCRAHVCTCLHMSAKSLQRLCKALQRLCKAPETPETPKSALQSLCRSENPDFGVFGVQTRKDPKPRNRPVWTPFASI